MQKKTASKWSTIGVQAARELMTGERCKKIRPVVEEKAFSEAACESLLFTALFCKFLIVLTFMCSHQQDEMNFLRKLREEDSLAPSAAVANDRKDEMQSPRSATVDISVSPASPIAILFFPTNSLN
jgi:hypothetical protein